MTFYLFKHVQNIEMFKHVQKREISSTLGEKEDGSTLEIDIFFLNVEFRND